VQAAGGSADGSNYLCPLTPDTAAELQRRWAACRAAAGGAAVAETVPVMFGRSIELQADQVTCFCWNVAQHSSAPAAAGRRQCDAGAHHPSHTAACTAHLGTCPERVQKLYLDVLPQVAGGAARFSFEQLCRAVLGPADYQALAGRFHTVFIAGIPALSLAVRRVACMQRLYAQPCLLHWRASSVALSGDIRGQYDGRHCALQTRDQARRFITLIDELYNAHVQLVS
jgi:predicted ATPase